MEKLITVAEVIAPIFTAIFLGVLARRKKLLTQENVQGLQQFVVKFGLPCVVFNSCLTADIGAESLTSMALVKELLSHPELLEMPADTPVEYSIKR